MSDRRDNMTVWFEYVCTECDFTMLVRDDDKEVPPLCPNADCNAIDSLMYVCAREVGRGVYPGTREHEHVVSHEVEGTPT
jgi:hypothetical protein